MNKYRNKKTIIDGIKFDSKKEAARYQELKLMEKAGIIHDLELQPEFSILPKICWNQRTLRERKYRADFKYIEHGAQVVEDVKSKITAAHPVYTLKRHLFLIKYPEYKFRET